MRYLALDIETRNKKPKVGPIWSLTVFDGKKMDVFHDCYGLKKKSLPKWLVKDLESKNVCKVIHTSQFDAPFIELQFGIKVRNVWDTQLCELIITGVVFSTKTKEIEPGSALDQAMRKFNTQLKYVLPRYGFKMPNKDMRARFIDRPLGIPFKKDEIDYMKGDVKDLLKLQRYQEAILTRDKQMEIALLENLVAERYHDMTVRGIGFDKKIWKQIADANLKEYNTRLRKLPNVVANWNSEKQVKAYFKTKGIDIPKYGELDEIFLATKNKTLGDFIFMREIHKACTSYGYNWFNEPYMAVNGQVQIGEDFIDDDGRIRCNINQIINTARNSMSNPNLQQLPGEGNDDYVHMQVMEMLYDGNKKNKFEHRRAFVPKPEHVFVINDFGGQEIGIMAAMADERLWVNAMLRGEDIHALTASLINPTEWAKATEKGCQFPKKCSCKGHKELRRPAKMNNFMLAYGGGAGKLAKKLGISEVTASAFRAAHMRVIPRLTAKLEQNGRAAVASGVAYSADPYQRRRVLNGQEEWRVRNQGKNTPIQMAGANMLKLALASIPWSIPIVLVIHDEIIAEVPIKEAHKAAKIMKQVMEDAADYITGVKGLITVDPKIQCNLMKELPDAKGNIKKILNGEYAIHL